MDLQDYCLNQDFQDYTNLQDEEMKRMNIAKRFPITNNAHSYPSYLANPANPGSEN